DVDDLAALLFEAAYLDNSTRAGARVFDCVGDEIGKHLPNEAWVARHARQLIDLPLDIAAARLLLEIFKDLIEQLIEGGKLFAEFLAANASEIEQIIDKPAHVLAARDNLLDVSDRLGIQAG